MRAKRTWKKQRQLKSTVATNVRGRLQNEVGTFLAAAKAHHARTGVGVGFWGAPRMLFPVYEDLLTYLDRIAAEPRSKKVHVWVGKSFRFNSGYNRAILTEVLALGRRP